MKATWQRGTGAIILAFLLAITFYSFNQAEALLIDVRHFNWRSNSFRLLKHIEVCSTSNIGNSIPMNGDVLSDKKARRRRKNKYENYSRVEVDSDPLDTLIKESNRMNQDIFDEIHSAKQKLKMDVLVEIPSIPNKVFPDIKSIDVRPIAVDFLI